ncbi:hypothetical protein [Flavobacterium sp. KACC 22763]|uniref:hypothetical protein n=1 Tax=Flavobacterium sp. KACC 22763 TaxID=3025668 RepID=UPI002366B305|nr:hypothetical protein [Flavobacterium sp. KACC 22763]WDF65033.1 hypothetical protein PQ463_02515 [Flavobacterium sp. KACC 22763]
MKLIENFYCIQTEIYGNGTEKLLSEGICKIKTELIRPEIFLLLKENKVKVKYNFYQRLKENQFSKEEMLFFEKHYDVKLAQNQISPDKLVSDNSFLNKLYDTAANVVYFEDTESNQKFLLIEFRRWQYNYQPRGAGEDMLGEDITYILGIWESPLLTDEIVSKIKASN